MHRAGHAECTHSLPQSCCRQPAKIECSKHAAGMPSRPSKMPGLQSRAWRKAAGPACIMQQVHDSNTLNLVKGKSSSFGVVRSTWQEGLLQNMVPCIPTNATLSSNSNSNGKHNYSAAVQQAQQPLSALVKGTKGPSKQWQKNRTAASRAPPHHTRTPCCMQHRLPCIRLVAAPELCCRHCCKAATKG